MKTSPPPAPTLSPGPVSIYESRHLPAGRHKACWGLWGLHSVKGLFSPRQWTDRRTQEVFPLPENTKHFHMLIQVCAAGDTGVTSAVLKVCLYLCCVQVQSRWSGSEQQPQDVRQKGKQMKGLENAPWNIWNDNWAPRSYMCNHHEYRYKLGRERESLFITGRTFPACMFANFTFWHESGVKE